MSDPSLPPVSVPPMGAPISSPLRRARDPDDDDDALEEGELRVPFPVGHESSSDTEDDDHGDDGQRRYFFQPRVEYDYDNPEVVRRPPHHRCSPRLRRSLDALDILLLGAGAGGALPSPTPSCEYESDATLSDDDHHGVNPTSSSYSAAGPPSSAAADAVDRGWAATGKRGWKAGGNKNKKPAAVVLSDSYESDLNTVSAGEGQAGTTSINIAQPAPAALHHQPPPPVPKQESQPPRAPHPPPDPPRRREREYTCKECGKSYTTNQALGGHAAGHKNKQREAEAMAAAIAAAAAGVEGGASLNAAFLPLRRGGGKADWTHECRQCGKVFASGVALGGHMRVHYTGPPIVPARKNKKRCLAPPPTTPTPAEGDIVVKAAPPTAEVGLSLALSIKTEENIATAPAVAAAVGLSLGLSIKAEEEQPSTPPAAPAGGAVRVVRLFGMNISPQVQQAPLQQQGSGDTSEDSKSIGEEQQH